MARGKERSPLIVTTRRPQRTMLFGIYENREAVKAAKLRARNSYSDPNVKLTIVKRQGYSVKVVLPKKTRVKKT